MRLQLFDWPFLFWMIHICLHLLDTNNVDEEVEILLRILQALAGDDWRHHAVKKFQERKKAFVTFAAVVFDRKFASSIFVYESATPSMNLLALLYFTNEASISIAQNASGPSSWSSLNDRGCPFRCEPLASTHELYGLQYSKTSWCIVGK